MFLAAFEAERDSKVKHKAVAVSTEIFHPSLALVVDTSWTQNQQDPVA